jgi:hypothetical protein
MCRGCIVVLLAEFQGETAYFNSQRENNSFLTRYSEISKNTLRDRFESFVTRASNEKNEMSIQNMANSVKLSALDDVQGDADLYPACGLLRRGKQMQIHRGR